jgi:hypothetical protein
MSPIVSNDSLFGQQKWFRNFKAWCIKHIQRSRFIHSLRMYVLGLSELAWFMVAEIIFEPILFAFILLLIFSRIQPIVERWLSQPNINFWREVAIDMTHNEILWTIFLLVFLVWFVIKLIRFLGDKERGNAVISELKAIRKLLEKGQAHEKNDGKRT